MPKILQKDLLEKIKDELRQLDQNDITINGMQLKPSSCYYFEGIPPHVLYNTNCPESLKEKIEQILSKYVG